MQWAGALRSPSLWYVTGISMCYVVATIFASSGALALACLSAAYAGILVQQPTTSALSLDVGRRHAGAVFGFANMASQMSSLVSSVAFGYIADYFGNYNAPFVPMVLTLSIGIVLWTRIDAEREILADSSALDVRPQALSLPRA